MERARVEDGAGAAPLRALLVSYAFPPTGGVSVGRASKLAKYLPEHGVRPAVLTASNPSVPLKDESLLRDVSPGLEILRSRTLEPGYATKQAVWADSAQTAPTLACRARRWAVGVARGALVPDPQLLWQPAMQAALARRLLGPQRDDVVMLTAPPFSSFLAGPMLRLLGRSAVVLDYRDEWQTLRKSYEMVRGGLNGWLGDPLEAALVRTAHFVTTANEAFRERLLERFSFLDPGRVRAIPNGYDPDDFPADLPSPPADRFVVTYAGTVYKLNSPRGFMAALALLHAREPALARLLHVRFVGRIVDTEQELFAGAARLGVELVGFRDKQRVIEDLAASHLVLCIQSDDPGTERIYPAKIFELMYVGRPCLTLTPPGALADLATRHRLGPVLAPGDVEGIAAVLARELASFLDGRRAARSEAVDIERYHRRHVAGAFAELFREAAALATRARA
jgi:glycosyltransferase involved in cell wall biosynthesis